MLASALAMLIAAEAAATSVAPVAVVDTPDPQRMTRSEIRAYNAKLTSNDPAYIKCRKEVRIGSLVAADFICHTNQEWAAKDNKGNENTREALTRMQESGYMKESGS